MQSTTYKLAEYKITENEHGDLWWATHIGLGSLRIGKCFINGDILFIRPSDSKGPGFLKGEFLDHLNKLPKWGKTKYYCASYKIYKCKSVSKKPFFEEAKSRIKDQAILQKNELIQEEKSVKVNTLNHISYKLHRYEIIEKDNCQLFWKSYGGLRSLKEGRCHIKGKILFLELGETRLSKLMKKEFLQQLNQLPDWDRTKYFCASYTIHYSNTDAICRSFGEDKAVNITGPENFVVNKKTFAAGKNIKPTNLSITIAKGKITTFFKLLKIFLILILKLLFGSFQVIYKAIRVFIGQRTRFKD
jgi:nucleoid DNA-binding protein